jgi:Flp pilus assembly protein TadD
MGRTILLIAAAGAFLTPADGRADTPGGAFKATERGMALFREGDLTRAVDSFTEALRLDPRYVDAYLGRAYAYYNQQKYPAAMADADDAVRLAPQWPMAFRIRSLVHLARKDYDRALSDAEEVVRLEPGSATNLYTRAVLYAEKKEFARAVVDLAEAARLEPSGAEQRWQLAWLLATCPRAGVRDGGLAVRYARDACELTRWRRWQPVEALAAAYAEAGAFAEAVKWQRKALECAGDAPPEDLGKLRMRLRLYERGKPYRQE